MGYNKNVEKINPYSAHNKNSKSVDTTRKLKVLKESIKPKKQRPVAPGGDRTEGVNPPGR